MIYTRHNAPQGYYCYGIEYQLIGDRYINEPGHYLSVEKCAKTKKEAKQLVFDYMQDIYFETGFTVLKEYTLINKSSRWINANSRTEMWNRAR